MQLATHRRRAEARMTDTCTVTRAGTPVLNETTGEYDNPTSTLYTGRCRVASATAASSGRELGDRLELVNRTLVHLPISASGFAIGDLVTVTVADDAQLVGAKFRVRSVLDSSQATARRLECEEA